MTGQRIGYIRVSSLDPNSRRELEGIPLDRNFSDRASGKDTKRPQLDGLISFIREGDTLIVHSMDRLAAFRRGRCPVLRPDPYNVPV